jgi:hypothetical protein
LKNRSDFQVSGAVLVMSGMHEINEVMPNELEHATLTAMAWNDYHTCFMLLE